MKYFDLTAVTASVERSADTVLNLFGYLPTILLALIILFIGWIVGSMLRRGLESVFDSMSFIDKAVNSSGLGAVFDRAKMRVRVGTFVGVLVEIFVVLVSALAAFEILGLHSLSDYIQRTVLDYIPNVFSAVIVLIAGALLANFLKRFITGTVRIARVGTPVPVAGIAQWAIWIVTILVALSELGVATDIINSIIFGFITALTLAFGLAFGLGGQEAAADAIRKIRQDIKED